MLVRVIRELTPEEVLQRIKKYEKEFGMGFEDFEELFLSGKVDSSHASAYFEWAGLVHAYRGYVEGGELDYMVEEIYNFDSQQMSLLTPKRIELLYSLASLRIESISDLAKKLKRNIKNVYEDLQVLKKLGFIKFTRRGKRNVVPETLVEEITFLVK
ncbi:hypothetical protein DRO54_01755 [Candidatus Bathyarchaeota archaeon]|nr:MAG: hypothetical protein DRO54_01755 [Candidatus Bathyarchaeota archaeon]